MSDTIRVLVADSKDDVRDAFIRHVSEAGFIAHGVRSGKALLEKIHKHSADVYICGLELGDLNVFELLYQLQRPPIIFVSVPMVDLSPAIEAMQLGAFDYLTLPPNAFEVRFALQRARDVYLFRQQSEEESVIRAAKLEIKALKKALTHIQDSYYTTLEALVAALDAREHETANHSKRVSAFALYLAQSMKLTRLQLEEISQGSLLHDVGKIGVADAVLLKPGPLSSIEWIEMKRHPGIGFRILKDIKQLKEVAQIVLEHQEKYDGSGYPRRIKGNDICIGARIFSVVDTFDAMTSDRPYRKATSINNAQKELVQYSGTQFDPDVVDAFLMIPPDEWMVIKQTLS